MINRDFGKETLYALFEEYGKINRWKLVKPAASSQPGYGCVQFANRKEAYNAIESLSMLCIVFIIYMHELRVM